jgi:hypothetical protein
MKWDSAISKWHSQSIRPDVAEFAARQANPRDIWFILCLRARKYRLIKHMILMIISFEDKWYIVAYSLCHKLHKFLAINCSELFRRRKPALLDISTQLILVIRYEIKIHMKNLFVSFHSLDIPGDWRLFSRIDILSKNLPIAFALFCRISISRPLACPNSSRCIWQQKDERGAEIGFVWEILQNEKRDALFVCMAGRPVKIRQMYHSAKSILHRKEIWERYKTLKSSGSSHPLIDIQSNLIYLANQSRFLTFDRDYSIHHQFRLFAQVYNRVHLARIIRFVFKLWVQRTAGKKVLERMLLYNSTMTYLLRIWYGHSKLRLIRA